MALGSSWNSMLILGRIINTDKPTQHTLKNHRPDKTAVFPAGAPIRRLPRASAEEVGLTTAYVESYLNELTNDPAIRANRILVVKEGKVIAERYVHPYTADSWDCVYSATKTVTALALGALWDEGKVDLDEPVCKILDIENKVGNARNKKITLRHLLTMSTGNTFDEIESNASLRWIKDYFDSPNKFKIGSKFEYNSLNTYVIGACLQKIAGVTLADYVQEKFFTPMGVNQTLFEASPEGVTKSGWGLYILPEDMAKLGVLVMNGGVWEGKRLLSEAWLEQMTHKQISATKVGHRFDYGYQMWVDDPRNFCCFNGMYNQEIHMWRNSGVVVVLCCAHNEAFHNSEIYTIGAKYFAEAAMGAFDLVEAKFDRTLPDNPSFRYLLDAICDRPYITKEKIANSCGTLPLLLQSTMSTYVKGVKGVRFTREEKGYTMWLTEGGVDTPITFDFEGGVRGVFEFGGNLYDCVTDAHFMLDATTEPILVIRVVFLEYASTRYFTLHFGKTLDKLRLELNEHPGAGFLEAFIDSLDPATKRLFEGATKLLEKDFVPKTLRNMFNPSFALVYKPAPVAPAADDAPDAPAD